MALTDAAIRKAKPGVKPYKMGDAAGLHLYVTASGNKIWRFKYRFQGKERLLSLGPYPQIGLKLARQRRDEARELVAQGVDPSAERKAAQQAESFEAIAREWLGKQTTMAANTRRVTERRWERYVFPQIGDTPISTLEPPDILSVLRRIEAQGKHETAHRMRQRIGQVFRYAIATGRAQRDPTADLKDALSPVPTRHRAAITDPETFQGLLRAIEGFQGEPATRAALRLLPLVFVRPGELRHAQWAEFDLDNALWRIPAERMKMKREHLVPLSHQALTVLRQLEPITRNRPWMFEGARTGRPISENTINAALRSLGYGGDTMTAHGFRSTASTLLHELGWPPEVIELQLAHAQRSQVAAAYNRSARLKERRRMMQAWADYLDSLRAGTTNVLPLKGVQG